MPYSSTIRNISRRCDHDLAGSEYESRFGRHHIQARNAKTPLNLQK